MHEETESVLVRVAWTLLNVSGEEVEVDELVFCAQKAKEKSDGCWILGVACNDEGHAEVTCADKDALIVVVIGTVEVATLTVGVKLPIEIEEAENILGVALYVEKEAKDSVCSWDFNVMEAGSSSTAGFEMEFDTSACLLLKWITVYWIVKTTDKLTLDDWRVLTFVINWVMQKIRIFHKIYCNFRCVTGLVKKKSFSKLTLISPWMILPAPFSAAIKTTPAQVVL